MENLVEQFRSAHEELAGAERRQGEAKTKLVELAGQLPVCEERKLVAARAEVSSCQQALEAGRLRVEELKKLVGAEHRRMITEAGELIRKDWAVLREARARRARLHEMVEAETALLEPSNSFGGPPLRRRIATYLGNLVPQTGVLGLDDTTFASAEKEAQEFLGRMLS